MEEVGKGEKVGEEVVEESPPQSSHRSTKWRREED